MLYKHTAVAYYLSRIAVKTAYSRLYSDKSDFSRDQLSYFGVIGVIGVMSYIV